VFFFIAETYDAWPKELIEHYEEINAPSWHHWLAIDRGIPTSHFPRSTLM
jgi:hypothetical protein